MTDDESTRSRSKRESPGVDGSRARILLLIGRDANREQLAAWLSDRHEVETGDDPVATALERCDLCLIDDATFELHRAALVDGKTADSAFLPYVLVLTRNTDGDLSNAPWDVIDEIIRTPIRQSELRARIGALLRTRDYSLTVARQNERLQNFSSVVSHDLRNPLNVARGRLELAREECDSDHLDIVAQAHGRMEALIADVLTLARDGEIVADSAVVDVAATAERCWRNVETDDATLVTETERSIYADPTRLQRLFENLVRNAVEHGRTDATITVGELDDGRGLYLEDDGPGIPDAARPRVFESGYSTASEGTGLGLAIVGEIVDAHGWDIGVSESADGGARFEITGVEFVDE